MIKSHPLTLRMKAWSNCQKNICLFVWSFRSSLYYVSGALPWYTKQLKPSATRRELFPLPVIWMDLKGFSQAGFYWNLAGGFCKMNTNTPPHAHMHALTKSNYIHLLFHCVIIYSIYIILHIFIIYINVIITISKNNFSNSPNSSC